MDELDNKLLLGMRSHFNTIEREKNDRLSKLVKEQEKEIEILNGCVDRTKSLAKVETPKTIRVRLPSGKPARAFQLHLSDTHSREIVTKLQTDGANEHNEEIGRERLRSIILQAVDVIKNESRRCTPVHLTVWGGGDWMTNADLHYKMERCVDDEPLVEMDHIYRMLSEELSILWSKTPTDSNSFVGSFSNHGRDSDKMLPGLESHRSYDTSIYRRLKDDFPEIRFTIAETPWTVEDVQGFKTMYTHGHAQGCAARRSPAGIMVPNWAFVGRIRQGYDFSAFVQGHQHVACVLKSNKFSHIQNGCLVGANGFSISNGYPSEPPSQNLAVVDVDRGVVEKVVTIFA